MYRNKIILLLSILIILLLSINYTIAYNFSEPITIKYSINGKNPSVFRNSSVMYVAWGNKYTSYHYSTPPVNSFVTKFNAYDWSEIGTENLAKFSYSGLQFGASGQCGGVGGYGWLGADAVNCVRSSGGPLDDGKEVFWCLYDSRWSRSGFPDIHGYIIYAVLYDKSTGTYTSLAPAGYPNWSGYYICGEPPRLDSTVGYGARRRTESILAFVGSDGKVKRVVGYNNATYNGRVDDYPTIPNLITLYKVQALNYHTPYLQCFGGNQNYECGQGLGYVANINEAGLVGHRYLYVNEYSTDDRCTIPAQFCYFSGELFVNQHRKLLINQDILDFRIIPYGSIWEVEYQLLSDSSWHIKYFDDRWNEITGADLNFNMSYFHLRNSGYPSGNEYIINGSVTSCGGLGPGTFRCWKNFTVCSSGCDYTDTIPNWAENMDWYYPGGMCTGSIDYGVTCRVIGWFTPEDGTPIMVFNYTEMTIGFLQTSEKYFSWDVIPYRNKGFNMSVLSEVTVHGSTNGYHTWVGVSHIKSYDRYFPTYDFFASQHGYYNSLYVVNFFAQKSIANGVIPYYEMMMFQDNFDCSTTCSEWTNDRCVMSGYMRQKQTCIYACPLKTNYRIVSDPSCTSCEPSWYCSDSMTSIYQDSSCNPVQTVVCNATLGESCCEYTGICQTGGCNPPPCTEGYICQDDHIRVYQNKNCDVLSSEYCPYSCGKLGSYYYCLNQYGNSQYCSIGTFCKDTQTKGFVNTTCQMSGSVACPENMWCNSEVGDCQSRVGNNCVPLECEEGYVFDLNDCICKAKELSWKDMSTIDILIDIANGIKTLLSSIMIPLILILLALGFGSIIILISKRVVR